MIITGPTKKKPSGPFTSQWVSLATPLQGSMMASLSSLTPLETAAPLPPSMAASALLRALPLLRHRLQLHRQRLAAAASVFSAARFSPPPPPRWPLCTAAGDSIEPEETAAATATEEAGVRESPKYQRWNDPDYRQWKDKEEEILRDIEPILLLTKDILHSRTYMDGERLKAEDEKAIVEKLLVYHPHAEDKVGCGLDSIMVDRHPQFMQSRCLFLIRTDGAWVDFSYQKCLRQYIREKYPSHAERFIREHFKRSSG